MDRHARFLEENQLLIEQDWFLFVQQYFDHPDDADNGWRGEYFGKMMRGACMTYQYTRSEKLYELLTRAARHMLTAQGSLGRFSSYTVEKQFYGWDLWGRKYVLLGFLHYLEICRDMELRNEIITALKKYLNYIVREIYDKKVDISTTAKHWNGMNSASILEPVVRMYNLTGTQAYLDFAAVLQKVSVNGVSLPTFTAGTYLTLCGPWNQGDRIELELDMPVSVLRPLGLEGKPKSKQFLAITYGPLVLARDARIDEVGTAVTAADTAVLTPCTVPGVTCVFSAQAELNVQKLMLMDYGSTGKTWSEASRLEAWIQTKEN